MGCYQCPSLSPVSTARSQEHHSSWLRSMLFNPSSRAARLAACTVVRSLLLQQGTNSRRVWTVLDMLCRCVCMHALMCVCMCACTCVWGVCVCVCVCVHLSSLMTLLVCGWVLSSEVLHFPFSHYACLPPTPHIPHSTTPLPTLSSHPHSPHLTLPHTSSHPSFSYLPDVSVAGEKAAEFLGLFKMLTTDDSSKTYLASKGILQTIGELLAAVS